MKRESVENPGKQDTGSLFFENLKWLSTKDAAIYLRKFRANGSPSVEAIRQMVYRGQLRPRKFRRSLYFLVEELDRILEESLPFKRWR